MKSAPVTPWLARQLTPIISMYAGYDGQLVHQISDWGSGAAAYFGWMREARPPVRRLPVRVNLTRRPTSTSVAATVHEAK
ncbi:MAG TPA: hypothetical protein VIH58_04830 [Chthoniobacterales bacterium]